MRDIASVLLVALYVVLLCLQMRERVQIIRSRTLRSLYASSSHPKIEGNREIVLDAGVVLKPTSIDVQPSILYNDFETVNITEIPVIEGDEVVKVVDGEETTETTTTFPIFNEEESQADSSPASPAPSTPLPINLPFSSSFKSNPKQYIRDPPVVYTSKVSYYNWGDGKYEYAKFCSALSKQISKPKKHMIINQGFTGGLGHKYMSIMYSISIAASTGWNWYLHLPLAFWNVTQSCLIKHQFTARYYRTASGRPQYPNTKTRTNCIHEPMPLVQLLGNTDTVMADCRMDDLIVFTDPFLHTLQHAGILTHSQSFRDYRRLLFRTLLNPSAEIRQFLKTFKDNHYRNHTVLGVQVRMGGCNADSQEQIQMMSTRKLRTIPSILLKLLKGMNKPVVYLATDSTFAERYLRKALSSYSILTQSEVFRREHTSSGVTVDSVKGTLVDLILLADSDYLVINKGSGFGYVAQQMTRAKRIIQIPVTHSKDPRYNVNLGKCV